MWIQKSGRACPSFAPRVLGYLDLCLHHSDQMSLAEFSAYHLRNVIHNLDMLAIARTTKLSTNKKENAEDATLHDNTEAPNNVEREFYGGEGNDLEEPEDEQAECAEISRPVLGTFDPEELVRILARHKEIDAAGRKGRKKQADVQMKVFDDHFHAVLNTPVPSNDVNLGESQLSYRLAQSISSALQHQEAIMKRMKSAQAEPTAMLRTWIPTMPSCVQC